MDRITYYDPDEDGDLRAIVGPEYSYQDAFQRLAAYEDAAPLGKAREWAKAHSEGRLVVLPTGMHNEAWQTAGDTGSIWDIVSPDGDFAVNPCPFCGGGNIRYWRYQHPAGLRWRVACFDCMANIDPGWVQQYGYLTEMWNKRVGCEAALKEDVPDAHQP